MLPQVIQVFRVCSKMLTRDVIYCIPSERAAPLMLHVEQNRTRSKASADFKEREREKGVLPSQQRIK